MSRNPGRRSGPRPARLSASEKILLQTKTRQLQRTIEEPTRVKIYEAIKNEVRWKKHRNDVLIRHIGQFMTVPESKKKKKRNKKAVNDAASNNEPSINNISITSLSTASSGSNPSSNDQTAPQNTSQALPWTVDLQPMHHQQHKSGPFIFGQKTPSNGSTPNIVDLTKSPQTPSTPNRPTSRVGYQFPRQQGTKHPPLRQRQTPRGKGRGRGRGKKNKRTFSEMNSKQNGPQLDDPWSDEDLNHGHHHRKRKRANTVYVDDKAGRRGVLDHANDNLTARDQLNEIIKAEIAKKHGKKKPKSVRNSINDAVQSQPNLIKGTGTQSSSSNMDPNAQDATQWEVLNPTETLADVGGLTNIKDKLDDLLVSLQCDIWRELGVPPPRSVLLHGPPGSGKTLLARAIAGQSSVGLIKVSAPELVAGISGQSESKIRSLFEAGMQNAPCIIFIDEIDVIAGKREDAQRNMETRIVAQLLTSLDDLAQCAMERTVMFIAATNRPDAIDSALRRGDRFDYELTMGLPDEKARLKILNIITKQMKLEKGFDHKSIAKQTNGFVGADLKALTKTAGIIGIKRILRELDPFNKKRKRRRSDDYDDDGDSNSDVDSDEDSNSDSSGSDEEMNPDHDNSDDDSDDASNGKKSGSGSDSMDNFLDGDNHDDDMKDPEDDPKEAEQSESENSDAEKEYVPPPYDRVQLDAKQLQRQRIKEADFIKALETVEPSARREGFATIPDVTWDDIGALSHIRDELTLKITARIKFKKMFEKLQIDDPCGVLLFGPPGCGKTLLAKAIAASSGASFISIKGPELLNKFVGESERAIRTVFQRARTSPPCIVFFDELDALAPKREGSMDMGGSANNVNSRVVNQLLTEMDGTRDRGEVFVIGATNRYDIIDTALMRPGRLGTKIYVGLPDAKGREEILKAHTRRKVLREDVDLEAIANDARCERMSGADLANLVTEAAMNVIKKALKEEQGKVVLIESAENPEEIQINGQEIPTEEKQDGQEPDVKEIETLDSGGIEEVPMEVDRPEAVVDDGEPEEKKRIEHDLSVSMADFALALESVKPSVTEQQAREYKIMADMATCD